MKYETRWYVRAWIRFWFNDFTRLFVVMLGLHVLLWLLLCTLLFGPGEYLRNVAIFTYIFGWGFAMIDSDYGNLKRLEKPQDVG